MHLRLARTVRADEMRVSWTAGTAAGLVVRWGTTASSLPHSTAAVSTSTYTPADMCGEPARTLGWWDPGMMHTAVIKPLDAATGFPPGSTVFYRVETAGGPSATQVFRVPAVGANYTLSAVLTADMGATTIDKTSQHWQEPDAYATTANMYACVLNGTRGLWGGRAAAIAAAAAERRRLHSSALPAGRHGNAAGDVRGDGGGAAGPGGSSSYGSEGGGAGGADLAFCVGDLSYATGYLGKWETFMAAIEPVASRVPYMTGTSRSKHRDMPSAACRHYQPASACTALPALSTRPRLN